MRTIIIMFIIFNISLSANSISTDTTESYNMRNFYLNDRYVSFKGL